MPVFTLKLIWHVLSAAATLLLPPKTASHVGQPSSQPHGAVTTPAQGKPKVMNTSPSCEWSIVCDDPISGEPRGLILSSEPLSESQALEQARNLLTTFRVLGTFFRPAGENSISSGLYLFTYRQAKTQRLGAIWAHSAEDAANTLNHMASCGNLLCYCEPE